MNDPREPLAEASEAALSLQADFRTVTTAVQGFTTIAALEAAQDALRRIRSEAPAMQMRVRNLLAAEKRREREDAAERERSDARNAVILAGRGLG